MLSDDELVEQILLEMKNAAEELIKNAIIHLFYVTVGGIALIWKKQKT